MDGEGLQKTQKSILHMFAKGVTLLKNREDSRKGWFHLRSLFCDLVPNLFGKLFLSSGSQALRA